MVRERKSEPTGLLIQGNFAPGRQPRLLKVLMKLLGVALGIILVFSLAIYGINVHYEMDINEVGQKTRVLNEVNKELLVKLNRIQSYQNVETAAEKVPRLHLSEEVVEVVGNGRRAFPPQAKRQGEMPRASGY